MFGKKKDTKKVTVPTVETTQVTVPTLHGLKEMVVPTALAAASAAKDWSDEQAKPRIEQGKAAAAPAFAAAADTVANKTDDLRDRFEDTMPKLAETVSAVLAAGAAARTEAAQRSHDAALVLKGDAKIKPVKKHGFFRKMLTCLGLLGAAGGAAALVAKKQSAKQDDPWARPLTDPYVAPKTGRQSTVGGSSPENTDAIAPAAGKVGSEGVTGLGETDRLDTKNGETTVRGTEDILGEPARNEGENEKRD